MTTPAPSHRRTLYAWGSIALLLIAFIALNVLAGRMLNDARIDATEDGLFTISEATEDLLASLTEPVTIRYYRSALLDDLGGPFARHARRMDGLLEQYARRAGGMLHIVRLDPAPYSPEEDRAVADGISGVPLGAETTVYLGLAAENTTDDVEAIAFLDPGRADFLEHDLSNLIATVADPGKPVLAVLGDLPLSGDQSTRYQPTVLMENLREVFDVRRLFNGLEAIDADVDALLLAQPETLSPATQFAVDQYALAGRPLMVVADPVAETFLKPGPSPQMPGMPATAATGVLQPLFAAWGIAVPPGDVVGDASLAQRVQAQIDGRVRVIDYTPWLRVPEEFFAADEAAFAGLSVLHFSTPGHVTALEGAETVLTPLVTTTAEFGGLLDATLFQMMPDPKQVLEAFAPGGGPYVLAGRVTGTLTTAFPDGAPDGVVVDPATPVLSASTAPPRLVVIADADMLMDATWVQRMRGFSGESVTMPMANNGDFVLNLLDGMVGRGGLTGLRGRAVTDRPFTVLDDLNRQAEARYRESEQALLTRLQETEARLSQLQGPDGGDTSQLSPEQEAELETFRADLLTIRQSLREVQYDLRREAEGLKARIIFLNVLGVPLLVAAVAVGMAVRRRRRSSRTLREARP